MVLMMAENELDPVFDSLAPVIALTHALSDGWMPLATMAKCVKTAQLEQRDSTRPWTAAKGPFGAPVATLKRMQWTVLEHGPFLWCMHDGRIVDPRRVCPHSMHILLKRTARAWQWRRAALHEGWSCRSTCARSSLTGSGPSERKYRAARTLSPLCALCGSEEGSLTHRHFAVSKCQTASQAARRAPCGSTSLCHRARCYQPSKSEHQGTLCPAKPAGQVTAACSQEWSTATASAYEGQDADLCVAGWGLAANAGAGQPVAVCGTLPFLIQDVDGAELVGVFMFLRIAQAPAQYVTDSSLVEEGVDQRGRKATEASTSAWADLWRDVRREIEAWGGLGDTLSVRKVDGTHYVLKRCWLV